MKRKKIIISLIAAIALGALAWAVFAPNALTESPPVTLLTIDGERLSLADLRGKPLLLVFWSTSCSGCIREMPHLVELYEDLSPQGLEIVAVAMRHDKPSNVIAMREARKLPYPIALDLDGSAARSFGNVIVTPTSFLLAPDGRIVMHKTGKLDMATLRDNILGMLQPVATRLPAIAGG